MKLSFAALNLGFSFAPAKILRLLSFFGFTSNMDQALNDILDIAHTDSFVINLASSFLLMGYHGFLVPVYGVGESRKDIVCSLVDNVIKSDSYGGLDYFVLSLREMILGNIEQAHSYSLYAQKRLNHISIFNIPTDLIQVLGNTIIGNMDRAYELLEKLDKFKLKNYSPSFLLYIQATALREKMALGQSGQEVIIQHKLRFVLIFLYQCILN